MTLNEIKLLIWNSRQVHRNMVDLQVYADKACVKLPITDIREAEKLLKSLTKKVKLRSHTPKWCIERYEAAHKAWFAVRFPHCMNDGHYIESIWPDVGTSNGLTGMIISYLTWMGHRATRISVEGRVLPDGTRIKSSTRKGTADISSTINGRSVQWEIKVGRDKPSPDQIKEQALERKAGGEYFFISNVENFFEHYDNLFILHPIQATLL